MTAEDYVHRIGRTGRMGGKRGGRAITFTMPGELKRLHYFAQQAGVEIRKSELSEEIPQGVQGKVRARPLRWLLEREEKKLRGGLL